MNRALATAIGVGVVAVSVVLGARLWRAPADQPSNATPSAMATGEARSVSPGEHAGMPMPNGTNTTTSGTKPTAAGDVVTLTPEMVARAGIKTVTAVRGTASARLHLPGVVQPNAYKNVEVTSLVAGRVTQVTAELGKNVMLNEVLATVYSPELADAQTAFIAAVAEHAAHDQAQARTQRLFAIGAASRQELERLEAEKSEMDAKVETARARLVLLGIPQERTQRIASPADVVTTFDVRAPIPGIITKRNANPGLNIDMNAPLFTVTDLSTVWIVADLYERDFADVSLGNPVAITTMAYPGLQLRGKVNYIDPQVQAETRTAKLRVEVPNSGGRLRLGMFVDVNITGRTPRPVVLVPRTAIQALGTQSVVYVEMAPGQFAQRTVTTGDITGEQIAVSSGVEAGESVVTEGGFFLRAERGRVAPENTGAASSPDVVFPSAKR